MVVVIVHSFNRRTIIYILPAHWIPLRRTPGLRLYSILNTFKKGVPSSVSNYRPISLTCVLNTIMERVLSHKLYQYVKEHNVLYAAQHGFVKDRSTCSNLLESLNDWTFNLQCTALTLFWAKKLIDWLIDIHYIGTIKRYVFEVYTLLHLLNLMNNIKYGYIMINVPIIQSYFHVFPSEMITL